MVDNTGGALGAVHAIAPLPPMTTARELLADALPLLDPPSRISVTEAAERYVRVQVQGAWQPFDRDVAPYMVEPTDTTQSRRFRACAFVGPSQSGKTKMLETVALHAVTCNQQPVLIVHMNRPKRDEWVEEKLDPTILNSPEIKDRLGRAREDSTFSRKRFRGMRLTLGYPTPEILSGGTYGMVLLTDVDHMPLVLGGKDNPEGSPFVMARRRTRTYLSRGCVLAEGSPAWPVTDPDWQPSPEAPHEMPPVQGGMVRYYNTGTRGRWYWECPDCGAEFEPRVDRLHYDAGLSPGQAGAQAEMECPACHVLIAHRHKVELNRRAMHGRGGWRHEAEDGTPVAIGDAALRQTDIASWALNGAAAAFSTWEEIVAELEQARRDAETLGDETDLATCHYTSIGVPHRSLTAAGDGSIGVQFLRDHAQEARRGEAPGWARFVTVTVDVQDSYFAVQVTAWGEDARAQVVDRFDLTQPPEGAPNAAPDEAGNRRRLQPPRYAEDWAVLEPLDALVVPVAGAGHGLRAAALVVDFQGAPGVSDNAEAFWKARRKAGEGPRWFLSRGLGGWKVPFRVKHDRPERASQGRRARSVKLLSIATDRVKDTVHAAMGKAEGGKGALFLPQWLTQDEAAADEFVAEERGPKGWTKKRGKTRNEGFDLSVQARAVAEHKGVLRIDWARPPDWAIAGPGNAFAVPIDAEARAEKVQAEARAAAPARISFLKRG